MAQKDFTETLSETLCQAGFFFFFLTDFCILQNQRF